MEFLNLLKLGCRKSLRITDLSCCSSVWCFLQTQFHLDFLVQLLEMALEKNGKFSDGLETLYFIELLEQHNIFTDNDLGNKSPKKNFKICGVIQFQGCVQISLGGWENFLRGAKYILWGLPTLSMIWFIF